MRKKCILFASDLDQTLIHSYKIATEDEICVERNAEKALSYMSRVAYENLQLLHAHPVCVFVPVTTRSLEQYRRICLLRDGCPRYAITSNGAILLVDGQIDSAWRLESQRLIQTASEELRYAIFLMENDPCRSFEARFVDEAFAFTKTTDVVQSLRNLESQLDASKVRVFHHGSKIYVIPSALHKGAALQRLRRVIDADYVISAGDSLFDVPMLELADLAFVPTQTLRECLPPDQEVQVCDSAKNMRFADLITASLNGILAEQ